VETPFKKIIQGDEAIMFVRNSIYQAGSANESLKVVTKTQFDELVSAAQELERNFHSERLSNALEPFAPPPPMPKYPYEPGSEDWFRAAGTLAISQTPGVVACKYCGGPAIYGYSCGFCGASEATVERSEKKR